MTLLPPSRRDDLAVTLPPSADAEVAARDVLVACHCAKPKDDRQDHADPYGEMAPFNVDQMKRVMGLAVCWTGRRSHATTDAWHGPRIRSARPASGPTTA